MNVFCFSEIARYANLRAVILGIMRGVTFLFPEFLAGGMVYVIAVYTMINGALGIRDFICDRGKMETLTAYFNLIAAGLMVLCGIFCIVYFRYIVAILPVFLGVFLVIESAVYFVAVQCVNSKLRPLLIMLAVLDAFAGLSLGVFTFGFGGIVVLSRMFGSFLLLSGICELLIYLSDRNIMNVKGRINL